MTDIVFKRKVEPAPVKVETKPAPAQPEGSFTSRVEPPYLDYEQEKGRPFVVDHYQLGDFWQEKMGGYVPEVSLIEEYIQTKIKDGMFPNNVKGIKQELKKIEKITGTNNEYNLPVKIGVIAKYVKFLMDTDEIKYNSKKYGQ